MLRAIFASPIPWFVALATFAGSPALARAALYAWSTQQTTNYVFTGATPGPMTVTSSTSAAQAANPAGMETQAGEFDAPQSYVGPATGRPAENFFGQKLQTTPDYSRADTLFEPSPILPRNVAELFLAGPGTAGATSRTTLTIPLTVAASAPIHLRINHNSFMEVDHPGTIEGSVQATHRFEVTIDQAGIHVYFGAPNVLNRTTHYDSFNSSRSAGSGQVNFMTGTVEPGSYTLTIVAEESVSATIVPEPSSAAVAAAASMLAVTLARSIRRPRKSPCPFVKSPRRVGN